MRIGLRTNKVIVIILVCLMFGPALSGLSHHVHAVSTPIVETRPASSVSETYAFINGRIVSNGGSSILERRFDWGTTSSCSGGWTAAVGVSGDYFSYYLTGLNPGTTYYFRAWAKNTAGWSYGSVLSFTTSQASVAPPPAPPATTLSFNSLTPPTITTSEANYTAVLSAGGSNFNNVNQVTVSWSGPDNGTETWTKGSSYWSKVTVNSDTSMTLRPVVLSSESGTQSKTWNWTVTLRDTAGQTASRYFTVNYTPLTKKIENAESISARIDSYSPNNKIEVDVGQSFNLSIAFTNTSDTDWDYLARVSVWDANGNTIIDEWSSNIRVQSGEQGSYSWTKSISTSGEYWVQFGVWKDRSTLLDKGPKPSQNLIMVRQPVIDKATGTISVSANINEARYSITGSKNYPGTGKTWVAFDSPVGSYTITYEKVNGYIAPPPETKTLISNGNILFKGEYIKETFRSEQPVDLSFFFTGVLRELGINPSGFALNALQVWAKYENSKAQYNPLATTKTTYKPGESNFNDAGVKNYPDLGTGTYATAKTLELSYYAAMREMLALKSFDEGGLKKAVSKWSNESENAQYVQDLVNEWKRNWDAYQQLQDRINLRSEQAITYTYPEHLWLLLKQSEYDELYQAGVDFDILSVNALIKARRFINSGDLENAQKYYDRHLDLSMISQRSFSAASAFAGGHFKEAESIVRGIYETSKYAAKVVSKPIPGATPIVDGLYYGLDFAIDWNSEGLGEAAKNLMVNAAVGVIFNRIKFDDLGGRTLKDALENRVEMVTLPIIQEIVKENKQAIASEIVKELSSTVAIDISKYVGENLNELSNKIVDELAERLIEQRQQIKLKSPGELQVYDSNGRVTGLVNGNVKNEIPRSFYNSGTVTILLPVDSYRYEVVGTDNGTYGLEVKSTNSENVCTFTLVSVPISNSAVHQYTLSQNISTQDIENVTLKIDTDGDGIFEDIITLNSTQGPTVRLLDFWPYVLAVGLMCLFIVIFTWRREIKDGQTKRSDYIDHTQI